MRRIIKYIISFIFILIVACSGLLCSAAIFPEYLTSEQINLIRRSATYSGLKGTWLTYTFSNDTGSYYMYGNIQSNQSPLSTSNPILYYPLFLSNFDTVVVQFAGFGTFDWPSILNVRAVNGSVATDIPFEKIGNLGSGNIAIPGSSSTTTYLGSQYQITISEPIDYLQITLDIPYYTVSSYYLFGLMGIQVIGTSDVLLSIESQVLQIGSKVDALTSAVQNATSDIGAIVDGQGDILTSVDDVKAYLESIDEKQDIIIYATQNDQLIILELDERFEVIKDELDEYKDILEQYYSPPDVNNVTNIIQNGLPNEYNPQVLSPVLTAVFDNSIVTTILIAVLALVTMSYVLFGKKG